MTKRLDPTKLKDWEIAQAAEETLRPAADLAAEISLKDDEWDPYGKVLAMTPFLSIFSALVPTLLHIHPWLQLY